MTGLLVIVFGFGRAVYELAIDSMAKAVLIVTTELIHFIGASGVPELAAAAAGASLAQIVSADFLTILLVTHAAAAAASVLKRSCIVRGVAAECNGNKHLLVKNKT